MTVETATERSASLPTFLERREAIRRASAEVEFVGNNYVTVSIPDLRNRQVTGESDEKKFRFDGAYEPMFTDNLPPEPEVSFDVEPASSVVAEAAVAGGAVSSLATIKDSIERSFEADNVDQFKREVELEQLAEQLAERMPNPEPELEQFERVVVAERVEKVCLEEFSQLNSQIEPISTSIRELPRKDGCTIVAFACSEGNEQLASILVGTANALSQEAADRVLIIDSDFSSNRLTKTVKSETSKGLSEMLNTKTELQSLLAETSIESVEFLAAGQERIRKTVQCESVVKQVVPDLAAQYDYILVNVGDAHEKSARIWSQYTNGSYLLVSMQKSNHEIAKSAVSQMNSFGARLIGCIASDGTE